MHKDDSDTKIIGVVPTSYYFNEGNYFFTFSESFQFQEPIIWL